MNPFWRVILKFALNKVTKRSEVKVQRSIEDRDTEVCQGLFLDDNTGVLLEVN